MVSVNGKYDLLHEKAIDADSEERFKQGILQKFRQYLKIEETLEGYDNFLGFLFGTNGSGSQYVVDLCANFDEDEVWSVLENVAILAIKADEKHRIQSIRSELKNAGIGKSFPSEKLVTEQLLHYTDAGDWNKIDALIRICSEYTDNAYQTLTEKLSIPPITGIREEG